MTEIDYIKIGERIKAARHDKGYTQENLSAITGISQPHIGHIESGKTKVGLPTLLKIANALDTTLDALVYDSTTIAISTYDKDFKDEIDDCSDDQKQRLLEVVRLIKSSFITPR